MALDSMMPMEGRRRRDSNQIKYEVLMAAFSGAKKTHIMYESGLNLKQLNFYINELLMNGALEFRLQEKKYYTTEKGKGFAVAFDHYRKSVSTLNKEETTLSQFFPISGKHKRAKRKNGVLAESTASYSATPPTIQGKRPLARRPFQQN
jgi:predicted transcriptional regulator